MGRHRLVSATGEMALPLPDIKDLRGAKIEQPERQAKGADQDEARKIPRIEHAGEHECLHQSAGDREGGGAGAQHDIAQRHQSGERAQRPEASGLCSKGGRGRIHPATISGGGDFSLKDYGEQTLTRIATK